MSAVQFSRVEPRCSPPPVSSSLPLFAISSPRRHSITTNTSEINSSNETNCSINEDKQIRLEVKTNSFNRKIQVKTKQEDTICRRKNSLSPQASSTIICSTTQSSSPHYVQIHQQRRSSFSNSSIQTVRVSVKASNEKNDIYQTNESESPSYSSMISNFVKENLVEQTKTDEEETFDRRPLLNLINELNRRHTANPPHFIPSIDNAQKNTSTIVPPKQLTPFRPVIYHKKTQEPLDQFVSFDNNPDSSLLTRKNSRNGITRRQTFTAPVDLNSDLNKISSDQPRTTFQSILLPKINTEENSLLSTSNTSLASTSLVNTTPTSQGTIDDKYEAKRKAIAMQMYDTEKSYVEALKNLVTKYYLPMKDKAVVSDDLINDIFYKIPEIHIHHTAFLISLSQKLSQWDNKQTVGDLLLQMFTRTSVIETYTSFVNNYKTAQIAIRLCRDFSSFNKFLEQQARDHRGKLTLRDLIIQPVQRIPRYELYIKDFLKCTNLNHPDYHLLFKAQSEIHSLAEQIDQVQREVGSTDLTVSNNSLEIVQDIIENLTDLVTSDRYYIRHDVVTLQSPSGLKKDRCIFLFNDLIIITSCKRRSGTLTKKTSTSVIVNSPSGKQYIDNAKHKLIMKIPLESIDLAADHLKKRRASVSTPPSLIKSHSTASGSIDKHRHFEDDVLILGQMTDLAKTITVPHQQLDDSIKETLHAVNKHLHDETNSLTNPEPNVLSDNHHQKSNNIQLTINITERTETIDVIFSSLETKIIWEKSFLEAKKSLFEDAAGRRNISFQHVLALPHNRPGSQFCCGIARSTSNDLCICNNEGEICLIDIEPNVVLKSCNTITSSRINCIGYIPSHKGRKTASTIKDHQHKREKIVKQELINSDPGTATTVHSLLDIDSSDDEDITTSNNDENLSLNHSEQISLSENDLNNEQYDTREATLWLGTDNGGVFIYQCSQTMKIVQRKNRIVKQLSSSIHSILYTDNKVFLALNHGELAVFRRDISGRWDLESPIIRSIEENSSKSDHGNSELDDGENAHRISVMALAAGRLWCGIRDRIFIVCPSSLNVEHSFVVDDCNRHISSITTGGSSMDHVWIASQGSYEIRLFHATHFVCLLETSIRTPVTQKLQVCDDIIRAHKLGCLHVTSLHVCKETLWVGTSAGVLINLSIPHLIDSSSISGSNKLTSNSLQLRGLSYGHAGPVRSIISTDTNIVSTSEEGTTVKTLVITIGDGFEDYNNNDETLGKDDALSHLILWQL